MSARREQSAGTSVHDELIYVVIPLRCFMLRHVRDKLFKGGSGLPPQGRFRCGAPRSPPRRGAPPNKLPPCSASLRAAFPFRLYLLGDDPQTPDVGFAHRAFWWFLPLGASSEASLRLRMWASPTRRSGGFCYR